MCSKPAHETYARLLLREGHGYPLWVPSPNEVLPAEYQRTGVGVGDVGLVTEDGTFDFLFNIFLPANDPINLFHGVPEGFTSLSCNPSDLRVNSSHHRPGVPISRSGAESIMFNAGASTQVLGIPALNVGAEIELKFSRSSGAVLMLPEGAARVNYENRSSFREYAARNAKSWYDFVNGPLGRETENGSLYLITGHDKTCSWELAAFSDPSQEISIKFTASGFSDGKLHMTHSSTMQSGVTSRCSTPGTKNNQAVFIRGFKIRIRQRRGMRRLQSSSAEVKYIMDMSPKDVMHRGSIIQPSPNTCELYGNGGSSGDTEAMDSSASHSPYSSGSSSSSYEETSQIYHPSDIINDYILDSYEGVEVAITHDDDWCSILDEADNGVQVLNEAELIRRVEEKYEIRSNDTAPEYAYLSLRGPRIENQEDERVEILEIFADATGPQNPLASPSFDIYNSLTAGTPQIDFSQYDIFGCPEYTSSVAQSSYLTQETRSLLSSRRRFKCSQCDKSYTSKQILETHIQAVHLETKFTCPGCGCKFSFKPSLIRHQRGRCTRSFLTSTPSPVFPDPVSASSTYPSHAPISPAYPAYYPVTGYEQPYPYPPLHPTAIAALMQAQGSAGSQSYNTSVNHMSAPGSPTSYPGHVHPQLMPPKRQQPSLKRGIVDES